MARKKQQRNRFVVGDPYESEVDHSEEDREEKRENSENPGQVLISSLLNGSYNYLSWRNSMIRALTAKDKQQFVLEDQEVGEEGSQAYKRWKKSDCLVTSWILNSISKDLVEGFSYVDSARELWKALEHRFCESNGPMLFKIKRDINLLEQEDMPVLHYFNRLKRMWDEMLLLRPIPGCKCGVSKDCVCNAFQRIADQDQEDRLIQFLMGLNSSYDNVKNQILLMDPLPNLDKVYSMLSRVEKQNEVSN